MSKPMKRMKRQWDKNRPVRPDVDPMLTELRAVLAADKRSTWAKANVSGLSPSTIKNIENSITRRPQATTLQMAGRMLGLKMVFIREN